MSETLRALVRRLADEPTPANRDAFYRALVAAQVAVPLEALPAGTQPGDGVADGRLSVPTTQGPDGSVMLLVYTDREATQASSGYSLAGRVVLEMAAANGAGVIVMTGQGTDAAWAGVPREHLAAVLKMAEQEV